MTTIKEIQNIAKNNPYGFTLNLDTGQLITSGYVVAYEATQNSFDHTGLIKCVNHAYQNSRILGGWYNTENKKYYYDSCRIFIDKNEAQEFAIENNQLAFFDLNNLT